MPNWKKLITSGSDANLNSLTVDTSIASGTATINSTLTLSSGSITDSGGSISFGDENLTTTGTASFGDTTVTGTLDVSGDVISRSSVNGSPISRIHFKDNSENILAIQRDSTTAGHKAKLGFIVSTNDASGVYAASIAASRVSGTEADLIFETSGTTALTLDSSQDATFAGDVHLDSAAAQLHVGDDTLQSNTAVQFDVGSGAGGEYVQIRGGDGGANNAYLQIFSASNRRAELSFIGDTTSWRIGRTDSDQVSGDKFYIGQSIGGNSAALWIDSSNNVEIRAGDLTLSAGDLILSEGDIAMTSTTGGQAIITTNSDAPIKLVSTDNTVGIRFEDATDVANLYYNGPNDVLYSNNISSFVLGAASTSNNAQFYATKTYSNASGTDQHVRFTATQDTASTGGIRNLQVGATATHTTGTVADVIAVRPFITAGGSGGTTTDLVGVDVGASVAVGATVTNLIGLRIGSFGVGGSVSNRWSIYSEDTGASYLAGDLRIGTTSTTSHQNESLRVSGTAGARLVNIHRGDSGASWLHFTNTTTGTTTNDGFNIGIEGDESAVIKNDEATPIRLYTDSTERLRIASDAYAIGIGTTDVESWNSSYGAIEIGQGGSIFAPRSSTRAEMYFLANAYYDGAYKYKSSDEACQFTMFDGYFNWSTAASGTADTAVSFSQRMRLTNDGKLGIGTTNPSSLLHLSGSGGSDYILTIVNAAAGGDYILIKGDQDNTTFELISGGTGGEAILNMFRDGTKYIQLSTDAGVDSYINNENFGIGTTSPIEKLHVAGDIHVEGENDSPGGGGFLLGDSSSRRVGIRKDTSDNLHFDTYNGVESWKTRITILNSGGNVGIGTTSPQAKLHVSGSSDVLLLEGSGSTVLDIQGSQGQLFSVTDDLTGTLFSVNDISGIPILSVRDDDYVSIGTFNDEGLIVSGSEVYAGTLSAGATTVTGDLEVTGTIRATGDVIAYYSSDERLKDNVEKIQNPLEKVSKLGGYSYNWNDKQSTYPTGSKDVGIIAQEVKEVLQEAVTEREDGYLAVKYEKIIPLLIESVNELKKELDYLKNNCQCSKK